MDPFSHLLLGYLLGFGLWGPSGLQYVVAAAVAGALPDGDVALTLLSKRFPLLRHRGISHSLVGVTVIAAAGAFLLPAALGHFFGSSFARGSTAFYFVAMEVGGLSHVLLDSMDHWSVPILAPFSDHEYRFDADRIVNVGSMSFTVLSYAILLDERGRAPVWLWSVTSWELLALALGYISARLLARWRAGLAARDTGFGRVIPQASPLEFVLVSDEMRGPERLIRKGRWDLLRGRLSEEESLVLRPVPPSPATRGTEEEALGRTHDPALKSSWILGETLHFGRTRTVPHGVEVFWYSLEMTFWGRAAGVLARWNTETGEVSVRNVWRDPARPFG